MFCCCVHGNIVSTSKLILNLWLVGGERSEKANTIQVNIAKLMALSFFFIVRITHRALVLYLGPFACVLAFYGKHLKLKLTTQTDLGY